MSDVAAAGLGPAGLYLPDPGLYLDARRAPGTVFVSHAHSDHCTAAERILCTPETAALHDARRGQREAVLLPYGEPRAVGHATVTLLPAAHTLGSAMIVSAGPSGTAAYTGDFKLRPNPFSPPAAIPRCDVLVMECTFGEPRYRFPPDPELVARLHDFCRETLGAGGVPVVLAYALGKAQEALWHLTGAGFEVMVHGAIAGMNRVHEALGHAFPGPGRWVPYRRGTAAGHVLLTTPGTRKTSMVRGIPGHRVCLLTGWALHPGAWNIYKDCDLVLPLSDHADYDELVRTALESGATRVLTTHGPATFADRLRALGVDATHVAEHPNDAAEPDEAPAHAPDATDPQLGLGL